MIPSSIRLACGGERDAALIRDREWLVTNGLGGYASGTVLGVPTRRYHGLFIPNLPHPEGRHLMIGRYDEELIAGDVRALLGGADLEDGTTESDAGAYLREFVLDGLTPTWRFEIGGSTVPRYSATHSRCQRERAPGEGRKSPSNSFTRLGSTVPVIASSGISRTAFRPARGSDRSS